MHRAVRCVEANPRPTLNIKGLLVRYQSLVINDAYVSFTRIVAPTWSKDNWTKESDIDALGLTKFLSDNVLTDATG